MALVPHILVILALDDGACDPLLFQGGGAFSQQQIKHLRVIHITPYPILNVHQVFMLIEISKIHIGGYTIIKTERRKNGLTFSVCK